MQCDECKFWDFLPRFKGSGRCRRFPRVIASEAQIKQGCRAWVYPVMDADDWCGEFQGREVSVVWADGSVGWWNDTPVSNLGLSVRVCNCLEEQSSNAVSIVSVYELCQQTAKDLLRRNNFGESSLHVVRDRLKKHGLSLRGESNA